VEGGVRGRTQVLATEQPHGSGQGVLRTYHLSNGWQVTAAKSPDTYGGMRQWEALAWTPKGESLAEPRGWLTEADLYRYIAEVAEYSWAPEVSGRA
jgi:hypothetical protein